MIKMKRIKWIIFSLVSTLLIAFIIMSTMAATPSVSPSKGPPDFAKIVFVHYPKGKAHEKPSGTPGRGPQEKEYIYDGYHWADEDIPVSYYINLSGSGGSSDFRSGIQAGFQVWEDDPNSYLDFDYIGDTVLGISSLNDVMDGYNVVGWENISSDYPNAIAVTIFWYNILTKELVEVDLAMNSDPDFRWWQNSSGDEIWDYIGTSQFDVDVQNIVAHEVGHWLVLGDLYSEGNSDKTMFGYSSEMELSKRSLHPGDEAGIKIIYPETTTVGEGIMHIGDINMWYSTKGPNYFINSEIIILDEDGVGISTALVYIDTLLPDDSIASTSGETNSQGFIAFKLKSRQVGIYTSTIIDVYKEGWEYDEGANLMTFDTLPIP